MNGAVLLLSSGLDSAANLALAREAEPPFEIKIALTVNYGQRGAPREIERAARLARHFGVEHQSFDLSAFARLTKGAAGALLGERAVPEPTSLDDLSETTGTAKAVWVPNRNGVLISLAAALAESRGLQAVAVGFNVEEAVTFPDNTTAYMDAMTGALDYSTANGVKIVSATANLDKREIVTRLANTEFPFDHLWSCYHAGERHCGRCESCQRLERAVRAGLKGQARENALGALFGPGRGGTC
jgi:7-cyano-7-deazaguanine synthase